MHTIEIYAHPSFLVATSDKMLASLPQTRFLNAVLLDARRQVFEPVRHTTLFRGTNSKRPIINRLDGARSVGLRVVNSQGASAAAPATTDLPQLPPLDGENLLPGMSDPFSTTCRNS
jgi:hypothetical protein